jgi:chromosome segregation ATPase
MKQPIRSTYEYSKYKKKPYIECETEYSSPNMSPNAFSYEDYFNDNYNNSIHLSDVDSQLEKNKLQEQNANLYSQTQNLNHHINDLNNEINTLNQSLHQAKFENEDLLNKLNLLQKDNQNLQKAINSLQNENSELKNQVQILSKENDELNKYIGAKKNNFKGECCGDNIYISEIKKLNELLEKYKDISDKNLQEKEEANKMKDLYLLKYEQNERDKDALLQNNNNMKDMLLRNKSEIDQLKLDNDNLIKKGNLELENKEGIIDDLRNQIDFLRDELAKSEEDKNKMIEYYDTCKKNDEKKINDMNNLINKLNKENEKLNSYANDNKRKNNKLLDERKNLLEKVNDLSKNLNEANLNNKRQQRRYGSPTSNNNQIFSNVLKSENDDLKELVDKYREMLNYLFKFVNDLNDMFEFPEINIDQCYKNIEVLIDDLNKLREEINNLLELKENNGDEKKRWENIQSKLLNREYQGNNININNRKKEYKNAEIENNYNTGNCWACKLGRNVSLKGASPYLCQKHRFNSQFPK